jgi:cellulose synthase/poly-beta-1,6-N-acetylglucosamine synthase-like glycosyltransferase/peptidoglycan/xylan/chitin deacetylase (PgdA/CDA1 family)
MIVLTFAVGLTIEGYSHGVLGENTADEPHPGRSAGTAPPAVLNGGPVINATGARPRSYRMPRGTVALTFDDGPDPTWTPKVLAVLRRYRVPATFFVVGAHVASYPGLIQQELRDGDEVGSHTYSHANLATAGWREGLELTLTQNALAGAAGIHARLLRPPFSSEADALTAADWRAVQRAGRDGYLVVVASQDTKDWARPGVSKIVAAAVPKRHRGAVIMFHDSGGNRAETVAALPRVIASLRARGYRFATVSGALGMPDGDVPASSGQRMVGDALVWTQQTADRTVGILAALLIAASALIVIRVLLLIGFARAHRRLPSFAELCPPGFAPDVAVVIPAYNEEAGIAATVQSMAGSRYRGRIEVIVVDDGSTDNTAAVVRALRVPGVRLISQPNGGKPAALNTGIAAAASDILILVDGDTVFQPDTIAHLVAPFAAPRIGAVSGNTKVGNRRGLLGGWQHIEYVMGFNLDRRLFDLLGTIPTVPGAIGAFRRATLDAVGWVSDQTLAEDTDLTMAICRTPWRVVYQPDAIAWTEAPASLRQLWRQRYRWCYGTMQAMWKHRRAVIEHGQSGRFGRRCLTYLAVFNVALPLIAPVVDVFSIYGLIFLSVPGVVGFWLAFLALQAAAGGYALRMDGERLRALWVLPFQQLVYRQLLYLVTIQSVITALLGTRQRWQVMHRAGTFAADDPEPEPSPAGPDDALAPWSTPAGGGFR